MQDNIAFPAKLLVLVSLIQGLILLFLHQAIELDFWPHHSPQWLFSFYSMAFVGPIMLLLGLGAQQEKEFIKWVLPFTLLCGLVGFYIGYQATPIDHVKYDDLLFAFVLTMGIAVFKALMYVQQFVSGEKFSYSKLFSWSWRNFLTLALSFLFAGCVWGVLMLWANLFKSIEINFFDDLFTEPWFYYPAIALANGFGVIIFRRLSHVIDTIARLQQALMKFLLILLVLVSIMFLAALPFTGLAPLWKSGGSNLVLWMQALMLFFINAVYQDDPESRPYQLWFHRFICLGVVLLPIYSAISFYGLSLRIDQYGWSLSRCWAALIWLLLALFSLGYLWGIIKRLDNWLYQLSKVNIVMGLAVLTFMLLINTPLLDFRKITVNSQLQRLDDGKISPADIDIEYFREDLARPGYLALQDIKAKYAESNPELIIRIKNIYADNDKKTTEVTKEEFLVTVKVVSGKIPSALGDVIYKDVFAHAWMMQRTKYYYLMPLDLQDDNQLEYLYVAEQESYRDIKLYYLDSSGWQSQDFGDIGRDLDGEKFIEAFKAADYKVVEPKWKDIEVGGYRLRAR